MSNLYVSQIGIFSQVSHGYHKNIRTYYIYSDVLNGHVSQKFDAYH